jgi:hypothetical protein
MKKLVPTMAQPFAKAIGYNARISREAARAIAHNERNTVAELETE